MFAYTARDVCSSPTLPNFNDLFYVCLHRIRAAVQHIPNFMEYVEKKVINLPVIFSNAILLTYSDRDLRRRRSFFYSTEA
jgi:hypothetical protein